MRSISTRPTSTPSRLVHQTSVENSSEVSFDSAPTVRRTKGTAMVDSGPEMQFRKKISATSRTRPRNGGRNNWP